MFDEEEVEKEQVEKEPKPMVKRKQTTLKERVKGMEIDFSLPVGEITKMVDWKDRPYFKSKEQLCKALEDMGAIIIRRK
jgi:hypothetical protein